MKKIGDDGCTGEGKFVDYNNKDIGDKPIMRNEIEINTSGEYMDYDHTTHLNGCEKQTQNEQDSGKNGITIDDLRLTVSTIWKTGLEVFIHQLLYRRAIYPRETFSSTRFVGMKCKINNNPAVCNYIANALKEIIPAIFYEIDGDHQSQRSCRLKELLVEIYDQKTQITHESFSLSFSPSKNEEDMKSSVGIYHPLSTSFSYSNIENDLSDYFIEVVERELRDLISSTGKLERPGSLVWNDSVSFKILLRFSERALGESNNALDHCLDSAVWSKISTPSDRHQDNRILLKLSNLSWQFQCRLL